MEHAPPIDGSDLPRDAPASAPAETPAPADNAAGRLTSSATTKTKIKRVLWALVEATMFRPSFHTMSGWRSFLLRCFGAKVGKRCIIRRSVKVYYPWNVEIGDMAIIGDQAEIYSLAKITIGQRAMVSQYTYLCAGTHDHTLLDLPMQAFPITIGRESWICAKAFVGPGVTIGEGAVVAACAVALKDVDPWNIVGGNPAKFVKMRELQQQ